MNEAHIVVHSTSDWFYSHRVWRQAVRGKWEVLLTQLSKLLSTSNYLPVVDPGIVACKTKICMTRMWMNWLNTISFNLIHFIVKVPAGKVVKVTFNKFLLFEPGQERVQNCPKDYVKVNGKK